MRKRETAGTLPRSTQKQDRLLKNLYRVIINCPFALEHSDGSVGFDAERYAELQPRVVDSLLTSAGISAEMLHQRIAEELPAPQVHARLAEKTTRAY